MSAKDIRKFSAATRSPTPSSIECTMNDGRTRLLFLNRVLQWLQAHYGRVVNLFEKFDNDKDNLLSVEDFTVAMKMMEVPATRSEVESLVNIIDPEGSGKVNILQFDKLIKGFKHKLQQVASDADDDLSSKSMKDLIFSPSRLTVKCPHCDIGMAGPPKEKHPRYIQLKIILAPFKTTRFHPGHFEQEVTETTTVHGLRCLVETHMEDSVDSVALFRDSSCSKEAFLDPSWCLGHCGLAGGTKDSPNPAEVYYDYFPTINRCPILMDESHIPDFII